MTKAPHPRTFAGFALLALTVSWSCSSATEPKIAASYALVSITAPTREGTVAIPGRIAPGGNIGGDFWVKSGSLVLYANGNFLVSERDSSCFGCTQYVVETHSLEGRWSVKGDTLTLSGGLYNPPGFSVAIENGTVLLPEQFGDYLYARQ